MRAVFLLVTTALALGLAPAAAQAPAVPDLFGAFRSVCGDHRAAFERTTAAAAAKGWKNFPLPIPIPFKDGKLSRKNIRFQALPGGGYVMFFAGAGEFESQGGRAPFEMCALAVEPAGLAAALRPLETWAGAPADQRPDGHVSIRFHEAGGKRQPLPAGKLKELAKTLGPGTLISIDGVPTKKGAVLTYTVVKL